MKESFYFHDDTVILNYSKQYVTSKHGIIHTDVFDAFLDGFLVYLEKNHYDYTYFETGISGYSVYRPLDTKDFHFLYLLFLYPEKFWKISNHYYNHRKSWISPKMEEKLKKLPEQNMERQLFLEKLSRIC